MLVSDSTKILEHKTLKKIRIETPIGAIESDSGNHMTDMFTIINHCFTIYHEDDEDVIIESPLENNY